MEVRASPEFIDLNLLGELVDSHGNIHYEDIKNLPVESFEPVVRCRECAVPHNKWTGCPKLGGLVTPPDFYCAFGTTDKT